MSSPRGVTLTRYEVANVDYHWLSAFRLRIVASDALGMDERVFLFRRGSLNPYTNERTDYFITVCSPVDMEDFPAGEPDPEKTYPFFRLDEVTLDFRTSADAEAAWDVILGEVENLVTALNTLENLTATIEVRVGDSDSSESLSES